MAAIDAARPLSELERVKVASQGLYQPVATDLGRPAPDVYEDSAHVLKYHGIYLQDDRDVRRMRRESGLPRDYRFMLRVKLPCGRMTAEQYLACDALAGRFGQGRLRVTSRQGLEFHGVTKPNLRALVHDLDALSALSALGASGDVVRNVVAPPLADIDPQYGSWGSALLTLAREISKRYVPRTRAYYDLWLDDSRAVLRADGTVDLPRESTVAEDPIYGTAYLPRKFKIALAAPFDNAVDALTNDVALIAAAEDNVLQGYDVRVGGGLGFTPGTPATFPQLAVPFAFAEPDAVLPLLDAIIAVFREHGDRANRAHARLKYLVHEWGLERFRGAVESRLGRSLAAPRGTSPQAQRHHLGWSGQTQPGLKCLGLWLEHGRIRDFPDGPQYARALRTIVAQFRPGVRFTPGNHVVLADIREADVAAVNRLLEDHGIPNPETIAPLRRFEMACPALPFCSRARAEAERMMPGLMRALIKAGHGGDEVVIRVSGCANGCARPRTAEIGLIGNGLGRYHVYVGGNSAGTRINELIAEHVALEKLPAGLAGLLRLWKNQRDGAEGFGDWVHRVGIASLKTSEVMNCTMLPA
jgi:sulfite reductase beta subunit-like hemoprotein